MNYVLALHSFLRWVVLVIAVVALVRNGLGWLQSRSFGSFDRSLMRSFSYLLLVQAALGIIFLVAYFDVRQFEHALPMLLVVGVPHMAAGRVRKAADDRARHRLSFLFMLAALLLIVVGVTALAGGWSRNAWLNLSAGVWKSNVFRGR